MEGIGPFVFASPMISRMSLYSVRRFSQRGTALSGYACMEETCESYEGEAVGKTLRLPGAQMFSSGCGPDIGQL